MRRFVSTLVVVTASALVLGVAPPVGAAESTDPSDWAAGFCGALEDWQGTAVSARDVVDDVITNGVASSTKAKATRKKLVRTLEDASEGSEVAGDSIKELGPPDVKNGAKISSTVSNAIYDTGDTFADAAKDAAKFSTDPKKFQKQVKTLKGQVDDGLNAAGEDIGKIDALDTGGELDAALTAEPACSSLSSS